MANDPAFLFYPGDYLRDTQCLSEAVQVAYDRIMCEHMRNICITQSQLKFFTKKLSVDEIEELKMVLKEVEGGYQISWVAESICKRKAYSQSRRENRLKPKEDIKDISITYDKHMDNENEIINEIIIKDKVDKIDFKNLIDFFNKTFGKKTRVIDDSLKQKYNARLKDGFTKEDIQRSMLNASKDHYHIENGYKYMTLDFFSRPDKLRKFTEEINVVEDKPKFNAKGL